MTLQNSVGSSQPNHTKRHLIGGSWMKLTDTFIRHVTGNDKVQKHSDGGGLFLYVTPTGKKSWRLAYRFAGKQKLISLGPFPSVSLREAREKQEEAKKLLRENIDPFPYIGKRPINAVTPRELLAVINIGY